MFKIKDGCRLELQTAENTKQINRQNKNGENVSSLEVVEVVLVQCNLVEN